MKPDNVTFEQATSAPAAAFTTLQGLRDKGQIQPGQKFLIYGKNSKSNRSKALTPNGKYVSVEQE